MQNNSNKNPTVSVIMPVYNAERTIEAAIDSILNQTWKDLELLVVVDPSTDKTVDIIKRKSQVDDRVRLVALKLRGNISIALNEGIRLAAGEFIARMDSDDYSWPERIEKQMEFMQTHPDVDVLGTAVRLMHRTDGFIRIMYRPQTHAEIVKLMSREFAFFHPTVIFRKCFFQKVGMYDPSFRYGEDSELWWRAYHLCQFANLRDVLLDYTLPLVRDDVSKNLKEILGGFQVRWRDKRFISAFYFLLFSVAWHILVRSGLWCPRHYRKAKSA